MMPIMGAISGVAGIAGGLIGSGKRKREQRAAQAEMNKFKGQYEALDTSNLMGNMDNTMEDLTVNTQQADFTARQQQNQMANVMDSLSGAAGGSGIAALAQSMANQGSQNAERAGVSIGQQERQNEILSNKAADANQMRSAAGAKDARGLEYQKTGTLLGMAQQRLGAANAAKDAATASIIGGVGSVAGVAAGVMGGLEQNQDPGSFGAALFGNS